MPFRTQASIDPNQHKGLILLNSVAGTPLVTTGLSLTNAQPMHVAIVDASGSQITSFGSNTQYAELTTTSPGTGTLSLGRYKSSAPTLTDGQMYGLQLDASGNLKVSGSPSGTQNVNITQVAGSAISQGHGTAATAIRVELPTDGTGVVGLNAGTAIVGKVGIDQTTPGTTNLVALTAETTKVIGVTRTADGSGNLLTSTANALDINMKSGSIANTSFAATQATASNLNATVVGTGTFAVQATLAAETTKVIGTVNQGTSPWVTSNATTSVVGNGAAATAQRVTLANDSTGIIATVGAVTSITNALPTGTNTLGSIKITDGTNVMSVFSLTNSKPASVAIVDGAGTQITSFGGGTQYAELTTTSPATGTATLGRYFSSPPSLTNGQMQMLQLDTSGNLKVTGSLSVGGTTDNSAFTAGTSTGTPAMGFYHSTIDTVTDGRSATLGMTSKRAMFVNLQNSTGAEIGITAAPLSTTLVTNGIVSTANSTAVNLSGGATFTGTSEDVTNYSAVQVSAFSSHVSATDGLSMQQSSDGTNWDITDVYTIPATTGKTFQIQPAAKFYRLVYTNGATLTTSLRLQTVYHIMSPTPSSQRAADAYTNETDLTQVWGFNSLYNGTSWDRVRGDITNGMDVDVTRLSALVAGAAIIGKVGIDQTTPGTTNAISIAQIGATTVLTGNGTAGAGAQRVTIASDNTAFSVNATLSAETTKVIGTVNQGTSPWVTSNATTSVVGNGAAATAQRVTLANDSTGILATVGTVTTVSTLTGTTTLTPGGGATNLGKAEDAAHTTGDTGVFSLAVRNDNAATSVTSNNADYSQFSVDTNGTQFVREAPSNTPTLANVASSATSVTILAANAARRTAIFYNDSTQDVRLKFGTTASATDFSVYLPSLGTFSLNGEDYAGRVDGIWVSANGNMRVTEVVV